MLGISVFFASALWLERSGDRRPDGMLVGFAIGSDGTGGFRSLLHIRTLHKSTSIDSSNWRSRRICLLRWHRFIADGSVAAFWEFNRILFQRILQSVLVLHHPFRRSCHCPCGRCSRSWGSRSIGRHITSCFSRWPSCSTPGSSSQVFPPIGRSWKANTSIPAGLRTVRPVHPASAGYALRDRFFTDTS